MATPISGDRPVRDFDGGMEVVVSHDEVRLHRLAGSYLLMETGCQEMGAVSLTFEIGFFRIRGVRFGFHQVPLFDEGGVDKGGLVRCEEMHVPPFDAAVVAGFVEDHLGEASGAEGFQAIWVFAMFRHHPLIALIDREQR